MKRDCTVTMFCGALLWLSVFAPPVFPKEGSPCLWRRVEVPKDLLSEGGWAGDLRIGDLDGDGQVDFLVFRSADEGMKPCFLGAFSLSGRVLWQDGSGGDQPVRPGPVVIHDLDGNGAAEVVCFFVDPARKAAGQVASEYVCSNLGAARVTAEFLEKYFPGVFDKNSN